MLCCASRQEPPFKKKSGAVPAKAKTARNVANALVSLADLNYLLASINGTSVGVLDNSQQNPLMQRMSDDLKTPGCLIQITGHNSSEDKDFRFYSKPGHFIVIDNEQSAFYRYFDPDAEQAVIMASRPSILKMNDGKWTQFTIPEQQSTDYRWGYATKGSQKIQTVHDLLKFSIQKFVKLQLDQDTLKSYLFTQLQQQLHPALSNTFTQETFDQIVASATDDVAAPQQNITPHIDVFKIALCTLLQEILMPLQVFDESSSNFTAHSNSSLASLPTLHTDDTSSTQLDHVFVGDIHGDYASLLHAVKECSDLESGDKFIFFNIHTKETLSLTAYKNYEGDNKQDFCLLPNIQPKSSKQLCLVGDIFDRGPWGSVCATLIAFLKHQNGACLLSKADHDLESGPSTKCPILPGPQYTQTFLLNHDDAGNWTGPYSFYSLDRTQHFSTEFPEANLKRWLSGLGSDDFCPSNDGGLANYAFHIKTKDAFLRFMQDTETLALIHPLGLTKSGEMLMMSHAPVSYSFLDNFSKSCKATVRDTALALTKGAKITKTQSPSVTPVTDPQKKSEKQPTDFNLQKDIG